MSKDVRVLLVEDSKADAIRVVSELRDHGYTPRCTRVQDKAGFTKALEAQPWDVVIAEYSLPKFSANAALSLLQNAGTDVPFIVVSGPVGEETAVAAMKAGAHDYIMKDHLARLAPALERELRDAAMRRERARAEEALRRSEERYRSLLEDSPGAIFISRNNRFVFANRAGLWLFGATRAQQVIGKSVFDFAPPEYHDAMRRRSRQMVELGRPAPIFEEKVSRLDGTVRDVEGAACPFPDQGGVSIQVVMHDIAQSKLLERGILKAVEQEQKRMGRDLHDGLCQLLTATKFKMTLLEHKLARKSLVEAGEAKALETEINHAIEQAHGLAQGLNPVKLVARGLTSALEELAASVETAFQVRCVCSFPKPVPVRDHSMANHLYRIAQEAVQNAVKHGKPKTIRIALRELARRVELRVEDDGVGFPRKPRRRKAGMGVQNMQARADIIGASLDIRPGKQGGTLVTCRLRSPAQNIKR
jgi:PAS domain S-box-containing protein